MENREIGDRLDAFAALIEPAEANPYTSRAYRTGAEPTPSPALAVAGLGLGGLAVLEAGEAATPFHCEKPTCATS